MSDELHTILLIEDHAATANFLGDNLSADGYDVLSATGVAAARALIDQAYPDVVVIDVGLPDGSGYDILEHIRGADGVASRVDPLTPVMLLSDRAAEMDRVRAFERGADDFLAKPASYPELRGRIGALLRRSTVTASAGRRRVGDLEIDPAAREVRLKGDVVPLSAKEYALFRALATEPTRVYTKDELMRTVWGFRHLGQTRTLDSHACRLRAKLSQHGQRYVVNVWGVGYRLVDGAVAA